jgi:hypothetical protein
LRSSSAALAEVVCTGSKKDPDEGSPGLKRGAPEIPARILRDAAGNNYTPATLRQSVPNMTARNFFAESSVCEWKIFAAGMQERHATARRLLVCLRSNQALKSFFTHGIAAELRDESVIAISFSKIRCLLKTARLSA